MMCYDDRRLGSVRCASNGIVYWSAFLVYRAWSIIELLPSLRHVQKEWNIISQRFIILRGQRNYKPFTDFISIIDYNSEWQPLRCYTSACSHGLRYV